ncbi:MAG: DUF5674 family protein [bacterium]|nr:DUF5674 family protein [bacterium]
MKIVVTGDPITLAELKEMAAAMFGDMVKVVVDVERRIMAVDAELHADEEAVLLERGSRQPDLWGINLYPDMPGEDFVEFDSMINLRPARGNRSRGIEDRVLRERIVAVVDELVQR